MSIGMSSSFSEPGWEESSLNRRIHKLEQALRECREQCAFNLHSPGNEHDTLEYVITTVDNLLQDDYVYEPDDG